MIVNKVDVAGLNTLYRAAYDETFATFASLADRLATAIPVTKKTVNLSGIKAFSKLRKWVGPRYHKNLEALAFSVDVEKYEDTVDVGVDDIEDGEAAQFTPAIRQMAQNAAELENELIAQVLQGTHANKGYDGLALGADTHAMGGTTYDNYVTTALSLAALKTAVDSFGALKDEAGKEINISPTHIVTRNKGSAFWVAKKLIGMDRVYESAAWIENEAKGMLEHVALPHITSNTFWAVLCLNQQFRPVLLLRRTQPEMQGPIEDRKFEEDVISWGVRYRVTAAPGPWQLAYISTGAG